MKKDTAAGDALEGIAQYVSRHFHEDGGFRDVDWSHIEALWAMIGAGLGKAPVKPIPSVRLG